MIVLPASDVFMLGCTFIEVLTGCSREPYDWLMDEDASGFKLITFRTHDLTRDVNPLAVRTAMRRHPSRCYLLRDTWWPCGDCNGNGDDDRVVVVRGCGWGWSCLFLRSRLQTQLASGTCGQ